MRLPMAGLFAIEEETGSPAWEVLRELISGGFRIEHVESVLFHAIRFGSGEDAALDFIERARMGRVPLLRYVGPAVEILAAALSAPERKAGGTAGSSAEGGGTGSGGDPLNRTTCYRTGLAMGLRPQDVDALTLWEFMTAVEAFMSNTPGRMSETEKDEIWDWLKAS